MCGFFNSLLALLKPSDSITVSSASSTERSSPARRTLVCLWCGRRLRELALPQGQCAAVSRVPRGFASLSRFAARRDRDPGRDALLAVAGVVHGGALPLLQPGGCPACRSRQTASQRSTRRSPSASGLQPIVREIMFSRGLDLLDRASLGRGLRRLSGDGAKRKRSTDGQRDDGLYEH